MIEAARLLPDTDDDVAEAEALAAAVAEARADPRTIPHDAMQAWLLRLAAGDFTAAPPEPQSP